MSFFPGWGFPSHRVFSPGELGRSNLFHHLIVTRNALTRLGEGWAWTPEVQD